MVETNIKIIKELKDFLTVINSDSDLRKIFTNAPSDFSRNRVLPFDKTICLIINMLKRSLSVEINDYLEILGKDLSCTKSAFCLQRDKLKSLFFEYWNELFVDCFYHYHEVNLKKWEDFLIIGIDGSTTCLPNKEEVREHFGTQSNQFGEVPMARIMKFYDVLNKVTIFSKICPLKIGEQTIVAQHIEKLPKNSLSVYDRGFPSYLLMYLHINQEHPRHFVMRCKTDFNKTVIDFVQSKETDKIVEMYPNKKAMDNLYNLGYKVFKHTAIKVRMVKVVLETREIEILLTNLYDNQTYPTSCFKGLYFMRWGIETSYGGDKNTQQLEQFSGQKVRNIEQDFYALIFVSNLQSLIEKQCEPYLSVINSRRKYPHKINKNVSIGNMKHKIVKLFLEEDSLEILLYLQNLFQKSIEPIRPDRKIPRKLNKGRASGKFRTLTNYKRAI